MKFELVELTELTGPEATIYSVILENESETLFDRFLREYETAYPHEISDIVQRLHVMATRTGARITYFKENEGTPGDGVCALYDDPAKNLRLYCIRYGTCAIILGSGGLKPKHIRALQEDPKLTAENDLVRQISARITKALKEKEIHWSADGMKLHGTLLLTDHD